MTSTILTMAQREDIRVHAPFNETLLEAYMTPGGTYMLATPGKWTDSGAPRDLIAVVGDGALIIPLYPAVNPDLVTEVQAIFADTEAGQR